KRIINLIAKGKDVSELFPAVVKNVAAKNVELKKLRLRLPCTLCRRATGSSLIVNQYISKSSQGLALFGSVIVYPVALILHRCAGHQRPQWQLMPFPSCTLWIPNSKQSWSIASIFFLADRRSLVLGSAVYAFEEICPNRLDLLHKHFRALCRALADVDEWGQVMMINLLTRYARSELADPELLPQPDVDLTLLLNSARPLLQSRNCSVVMAVTQLFYYTAPKAQLSQVARALVRLLRGPREVQYVVLLNIATICERNPVLPGTYAISKNMFDPFLKSFFVRSSDPSFVKELKLHILTSLVSEANVHIILRELQVREFAIFSRIPRLEYRYAGISWIRRQSEPN
ncbi:adaptin region, partial [Cooperia oncophora]